MSRHYEKMKHAIELAKENIVNALMQYVMNVGEDFSDYHRNEFGIEEEEDEEDVKVLKVLNIFDNGGCYFPWTNSCQVDKKGMEDFYWHTFAFHCLYVVEQDGIRDLKYYMLWNGGKEYHEEISEPDHDYVSTLPLQVMDRLIEYVNQYELNEK